MDNNKDYKTKIEVFNCLIVFQLCLIILIIFQLKESV